LIRTLGFVGLAAAVLTLPAQVLANGGTLRLANVPMGEYRVSVFTDPTPVRPDSLDVSVLVLGGGREGLAEGVRVMITASPLDHPGPELRLEATRDQADDPRYHAAKFALGHEGRWRITVAVQGELGGGAADFELRARDRGLLGHPLVLSLLALLPLAALGWWLLTPRAGDVSPADRPGGAGDG
jgi:hypothetical protein